MGGKSKNKMGRPPIVDDLVIKKLEEAFALGCTDLEACLFAGIGKSTLYNYQNAHPDFVERKELLKERPVLLARKTVCGGLEEDKRLAFDYLVKKRHDEFADKRKTEVGLSADTLRAILDGLPDELSEQVRRKLTENIS